MDAVERVRVSNTLHNWDAAGWGQRSILLFADDADGCAWVHGSTSASGLGLPGVTCKVHACNHRLLQRPVLTCLLEQALLFAVDDLLCWINNDILLGNSFAWALLSALALPNDHVLIVGRRTDVPLDTPLVSGESSRPIYNANLHTIVPFN